MSSASPALQDDGGARHLKRGRRMPDILLPTTAGREVSFARLSGRVVVYCYPWTGRPGLDNPPGWDDIPGAHGSTPQTEGFRNLYDGFRQVDAEVFGLSTQSSDHQRELVERLGVPFEIVSDAGFALAEALSLPTFTTGGVTYLKRLTLGLNDGRIERVFYPVRSPNSHAREVCAWLGMLHSSL
ncbi:MAG: peroxiredoxin [Hyphomicrobiaceae bacterium]|nr:MAG: peroxiredoxin [Hyphomicrobiaceae bacterium]